MKQIRIFLTKNLDFINGFERISKIARFLITSYIYSALVVILLYTAGKHQVNFFFGDLNEFARDIANANIPYNMFILMIWVMAVFVKLLTVINFPKKRTQI